MRKRGKPARKQASGNGPAQEHLLEEDGLVFWPQSLGQPDGPRLVQIEPRRRQEPAKPPRRRRAVAVLFVFLFFAGAALTAAAGNEVATLVASGTTSEAADTATTGDASDTGDESPTDTVATTETTTTTDEESPAPDGGTSTDEQPQEDPGTPPTTTGEEPAPPPPPPPEPGTTTTTPQPPPEAPPAETPPPAPAPDDSSGGDPGPAEQTPDTTTSTVPTTAPPAPVVEPAPILPPQPEKVAAKAKSKAKKRAKPDYSSLARAPRPEEVEHEPSPGVAPGNTRWIDQPLPDPTPPSLRLTPQFARALKAVSASAGLDWDFLLATLRAEKLGRAGQVEPALLERKAATLARLHEGRTDRQTLAAYDPDKQFADRVLVLERYFRAVGLRGLVKGLVAESDRLAAKVLSDPRIDIYAGGRDDISSGRVDVRVVAMIAYLAESFGEVRVSCLISGHRLYSRPGVISAHIFGRGLDIAALSDVSIYGHQEPEGVTERATRQILLLPAEVLPRQVISLIGLGGPSFPLADHADHIHIGY